MQNTFSVFKNVENQLTAKKTKQKNIVEALSVIKIYYFIFFIFCQCLSKLNINCSVKNNVQEMCK